MDFRSDKEIFLKIKEGSYEEYEILANRYRPSLWKLVYLYTENPSETDELIVSILKESCIQLGTYRETVSFREWLFKFSRNYLINKGYKIPDDSETPDKEILIDIKSDSPDRMRLKDNIKNLGKQETEILILRFFADIDVKGIATILDKDDQSISNTLKHIINRISN